MKVSRALAVIYRNKQAVRCSAGKAVLRDSDVIIETNKQCSVVQQRFDCGNRAGALDTA